MRNVPRADSGAVYPVAARVCGHLLELSQLYVAGWVDFEAPGAAWFIGMVVLGTEPAARLSAFGRPDWEDVADTIFDRKRPLWEALAEA